MHKTVLSVQIILFFSLNIGTNNTPYSLSRNQKAFSAHTALVLQLLEEMKLFVFVISLAFNYFCAFSQNSHEILYVVGCFYNGTTEVQVEFDEDLVFYTDFQNNEVVFTMPPFFHFDMSQFENLFRNAVRAQKACLGAATFLKRMDDDSPEEKEPPESILYPAEDVQTGVKNQLICFVNRFYPPFIKVTWTKNNRPVSEGVSFSPYYPNNDQTFHYFSSLTFKPKQGDVYSCTVEHSALEKPKTKIWDVDLESHQDLTLDFYCGVGLTVAFVGVIVGTFLIIKARYGQL